MIDVPTSTTPTAVATKRFAWTRAWAVVRDYGTLLKPKVIGLLLAFGAVAARLADPELSWTTLTAFLVTGAAAAGGAAALNHVHDRHRDAVMRRTRHRPIPSGRVTAAAATRFAAILLSVGLLGARVALGPLAALWMAVGAATYAGLYTRFLKTRTDANIVIGGAAGSFGVFAGWSAAGAPLDATAWLLAALVFLWTPPHFWGLAIARDADYRAVKVPMLPQTRGVAFTSKRIFHYALATFATSLLLVPVAGFGLAYAVVALLAGGAFVALCRATARDGGARMAGLVFRSSGAYLAVLLVAMLAAAPR